MSEPVIRPAVEADLAAITRIYAHHVMAGLASFEETPPDLAEISRRWHAIAEAGLPYVVAMLPGENDLAGYAYAGPYRPRSAYRFTVEDSIYLDPRFQQKQRSLILHSLARNIHAPLWLSSGRRQSMTRITK